MKAKIFLIIMMILFAVSCANNNPANPVQNNNEAKNTENNNNNSGNTSGNSGNTSSNNNGSDNEGEGMNYGDKPPIGSLDGIAEYKGNAQLSTKGLDGRPLTGPEDINEIYVDIYEEEKIASVHIRNIFHFDDIKLDNSKHTYYSTDEKGDYTLTMTVGNDFITDFQVTIYFKGDNYKSYITAEKLEKIIRN